MSRSVTEVFAAVGIHKFEDACSWIRTLPYGRNENPAQPFCIFEDLRGTCSTKHILLKRFADELAQEEVQLAVGLFLMSGKNTPKLTRLLEKYGLPGIPEAHCYLKSAGTILDCTSAGTTLSFISDLLYERHVMPQQVISHKARFHQAYLQRWHNAGNAPHFSLLQLWEIREACIAQLSVSE